MKRRSVPGPVWQVVWRRCCLASQSDNPPMRRVLRFVPQANLTVLDPIVTTAAVTVNHAWMVWDTLFGANAAQLAKPQMAEGYVSDDGRTYLIKLREGLRWHDSELARAGLCGEPGPLGGAQYVRPDGCEIGG